MDEISKILVGLRDEKYRQFTSRLIPNVDINKIIGVRVPELRKLAKEILSRENEFAVDKFLNELPHYYLEENNIHCFIIAFKYKNFDEAVYYTEAMLPYIDNWATCDLFSPKAFKKEKEKFYNKTLEWIESDDPYTVRYGVVRQIESFLGEDFKPYMIDEIKNIRSENYYVNMAVAWYLSIALIKQYESTISIFEKRELPVWVHNKALQKARESLRISPDRKEYFKALKLKGKDMKDA